MPPNRRAPRNNTPASVLPFPRSAAAAPVSRAEIERLVVRGRRLQGEALRAGLRQIFRHLVGGCSLRGLRLSGPRQPCC